MEEDSITSTYAAESSGTDQSRWAQPGRRRSHSIPAPTEPAPPTSSRWKDVTGYMRNEDKKPSRYSAYGRRCEQRGSKLSSRQNSIMMVKTPGYSINRTPSSVEMTINTNTFFKASQEEGDEIENSLCANSKPSVAPSRPGSAMGKALEAMTEQVEKLNLAQLELQMEVVERRMELDREKESHQEELKKVQREFKSAAEQSELKHRQELSDRVKEYEAEMEILNTAHEEKIQRMKSEFTRKEANLIADLEVAGRLHATATDELRKGHKEAMVKLESKLRREHDEEKVLLESVFRNDSNEKLKLVTEEMSRKQQHQLEEIEETHHQEMERIKEEFSQIDKLKEEVVKSRKQAKRLEKQLSKLKVEVKSSHQQHVDAEARFLETEAELKQFKEDFRRNVREAQVKTKDRLDDLTLENSQLIKRLLTKSEEFSLYRAAVESTGAKALLSFKEKVGVMVRARNRASLSVAMGLTDDEAMSTNALATPTAVTRPRSSSVPVTKTESFHAKSSVLSADRMRTTPILIPDDDSTTPTAAGNEEAGAVATVRPKSCFPDFHHVLTPSPTLPPPPSNT